jgi:hypothetical protein
LLKWITTTLAVAGDEWPEEDILDADEAVEWIIEARGTDHVNVAFVQDDATARQVLAGLGLDEHEIEDRFSFAAGAYRAALADHTCGCQG